MLTRSWIWIEAEPQPGRRGFQIMLYSIICLCFTFRAIAEGLSNSKIYHSLHDLTGIFKPIFQEDKDIQFFL